MSLNVQSSYRLQSPVENLFEKVPVSALWLPPDETDSMAASEFAQALTLSEFQLGEILLDIIISSQQEESVHNELFGNFVYLVCQGKLRLLCLDLEKQREVSAQVLEAGGTFGVDPLFCQHPLPYRAIAASAGQIARIDRAILIPLLKHLPRLRSLLEQQATQREHLIFFKSLTNLRSLTSHQIEQVLPHLERVAVSAGTPLVTVAESSSHYSWLRQGNLQSEHDTISPPSVGDSWGYPNAMAAAWTAQTEVLLYQLPAKQWETLRAIAPTLGTQPPESGHPPRTALDSRNAGRALPSASSVARPPVPSERPTPTPVPNSNQIRAAFPQPKRQQRWRLWQSYPFIAQQSTSDCGVTCLTMIGQYWGKRFSLNTLRDLANVGRSGASLKNLAKTAEAVGFHSRPVRASLGRLAEQRNPWIAHWEGDHYVVVYWMRRDRILIADPARGKRTLSRQEFLQRWTGYALLLDPTNQLTEVEPKSEQSLWHFWQLLTPYRSILWQIILISLLIQVFGLVAPLFTQVILDKVVVQKSLEMLHVFAFGLVIFSIWRIGLTGVRQYLLDYFSNRLDLTLVSGFISHVLRLPMKFFESRQVGDIITRIQENQKIQLFLIRQAVSTWLDAVMAIVYTGLMFYYNWQLSVLVLCMIPPIIVLTLGATPFLKRISREIFNEAAEQNSLVVEMMTGIATVKAAAAEQEIRWRWEDRLTTMLNVRFKGQKLANMLQIASGSINALGSAILLWYGAGLVIQGQLTIGQFVAFNMLIGNVIGPILAVIGVWDELQEVLISVERLNDVFSTEPEEHPGRPMLVLPPIRGDIRFDNVTFSYDTAEDHNTLQNLSIAVQSGQTVAIVGRSGSGKTTLVKLLQGLYHPTRGRVLIDGHDVHHVSPHSLRSQLGVVPQECFLFSGTVLENIQLYRPEFGLDSVIEAAKLAEAHAFIQDLPLGYNTKVGERGSNLSGGQRQRIAIARALLGDPKILVLDEATSSLDTESERRFQQNLARISRDRTTFIIAHRLSTVQHADLILVLDRGVLVEQGTHEELIAVHGLYYHLAQQQLNL